MKSLRLNKIRAIHNRQPHPPYFVAQMVAASHLSFWAKMEYSKQQEETDSNNHQLRWLQIKKQ